MSFEVGGKTWHRYFDPERPALDYEPGKRWEPHPRPGVGEFLLSIASHLPSGAVLCIEATRVDPMVVGTLVRHATEPTENVRPDTMGDRLRVFHLPASPRVLTDLGSLLQRNPSAEWGHHLKIYAGSGILVHLHDEGVWEFSLSDHFSAPIRAELEERLGCEFTLI